MAQKHREAQGRPDDSSHATTGAAIILLAGFVVTLVGAIREFGVLACWRRYAQSI